MSWGRQLRELAATMRTARFWYTVIVIACALLVWIYLYHLAIKHLDTSLSLYSTFCSSRDERNRHILVLVLLTPLFLVGLIGVIGEWMQFIEGRHKGRRVSLKYLVLFLVLMQVTGLGILIALDC